MKNEACKLGMVGLGVMGRNLLLNMADHGYPVAGFDKDGDKTKALRKDAGDRHIRAVDGIENLVSTLEKPRTIMLLVPAGRVVDLVIEELRPLLAEGDLIIDGGNSHYTDTDRRAKGLAEAAIHYIGMGVSGGAEGARHGPSLMPGGDHEAYERVAPLFEAVAAQVDGNACVAFLGPHSAGHYVKMVHNGIEYAVMQLIAETYDIMRRGLHLEHAVIQNVFRQWNEGELSSYLMEITANIFGHTDEHTGRPLLDMVLDQARQKGTGMWTSQDAMELQAPTPAIDAAVGARHLSSLDKPRSGLSGSGTTPPAQFPDEPMTWLPRLRHALQAATITAYAQGFSLLHTASEAYDYYLRLEEVARIWRGGCIIRAALLDDFRAAFQTEPALESLLLDEDIASRMAGLDPDWRAVVAEAARSGVPVPAMMASLAYVDALRSDRLPANLIQAQRDYFGSHTYERVDRKGTFHTQWSGS